NPRVVEANHTMWGKPRSPFAEPHTTPNTEPESDQQRFHQWLYLDRSEEREEYARSVKERARQDRLSRPPQRINLPAPEPIKSAIELEAGRVQDQDTGDYYPAEPERMKVFLTGHLPLDPTLPDRVTTEKEAILARLKDGYASIGPLPERQAVIDLGGRL